MKHIFTLGFASILALAACAEASSAPEAAQQTSAPKAVATTGNWDIVPAGSEIRFTALQEGDSFSGTFDRFDGIISFDPDAPEAGSVKIDIPLAGVKAGSTDRDSTLPGKVWFSTKAFPTASFTSTDIARDGDGYIVRGTLSLKGASHPVELPFSLEIDGDRALMTGRTVIDRTQWDVGADPWNTDEWVSREVTLDIRVSATRIR